MMRIARETVGRVIERFVWRRGRADRLDDQVYVAFLLGPVMSIPSWAPDADARKIAWPQKVA